MDHSTREITTYNFEIPESEYDAAIGSQQSEQREIPY